ncbi:DNA primase [Candidatus Nomurabacteria bacterium]|uniref:DNA primase n=1 Tax=candidate division WWE3 bacterium TaxID=2053526 RepID=A0A955IX98_UNCKA|nr:DNA primase [candidate division WWE3 bacterium]MCB9823454.1 DNA primase [Candidatus Nomurabacteria bacterium]MCB9827736.1 DNA primase [Candidatus Nomurabacteria bacterium]
MDSVSQVKQALNIVDVIGKYVDLKKSGRNYKGNCPFHSENTPSLMVSSELQIFKCFGCGEAGDIFSFIQAIEGVEFPQALERLADLAGIVIEKKNFDPDHELRKVIYKINADTASFYNHLLVTHAVGKPGLVYLKEKRKLTGTTISDFKVGFAPKTKSWDLLTSYLLKKGYTKEQLLRSGVSVEGKKGLIDKFVGRVVFPLRDVSEKTVGFTGRTIYDSQPKYLNTSETLVFHKSSFIYGLDRAKLAIRKEGAVFVEGQLDVLTSHQSGFLNVVASSGTALTTEHLKILGNYTNQITFCFDPDKAGRSATDRAVLLADKFGFDIKVALIPSKYADLDELLRADPLEAERVLRDAVNIYDFYISYAMSDNDATSSEGKKKILAYLAPKVSLISNGVTKDHYIKKISAQLDVSEDVIRDLVAESSVDIDEKLKSAVVSTGLDSGTKVLIEDYLFSLLMKAPIDLANDTVYKLDASVFTLENRDLFSSLKDYLLSAKDIFSIKQFTETIQDEILRKRVMDLFLFDYKADLLDNDKVLKNELADLVSRLRKEALRRELKTLSDQIKVAELGNDSQKVKSLSQEFTKLSKKIKEL